MKKRLRDGGKVKKKKKPNIKHNIQLERIVRGGTVFYM